MEKEKNKVFFLLLLLLLILTACTANKPINYTKHEGSFSQSDLETITDKYEIKSTGGFGASLDFELKQGKVDWEVINPNGEAVFKGYVTIESGTTYSVLTVPSDYMEGRYSKKQGSETTTDSEGNLVNVPEFFLQFDPGSSSGVYTLKFKPLNAEGSYTVIWSDKLSKK